MLYTYVSSKEVIARIIRNTRIQDSSFIEDMSEWIPEAMGYMRTKQQLNVTYKDIEISFYKGKMPCGLIGLGAVECCGGRMRYANTVRAMEVARQTTECNNETTPSLFITEVATQNQAAFTGPQNYIWKTDLVSAQQLPCCNHYYNVEMGYINTSMCEGTVRLHYTTMPIDEEGFPLIPDNENYKEALYCYNRAKMIGAGYKDTVYSENELMQRFELYASRAMGQIKYPSVDQMQTRINTLTRFILPEYYWEDFFSNPGSESVNHLI